MKQINLIPWREQAREQLKREFFNMLAAAMLFSLLLLAIVYFIISTAIKNQNNINYLYQHEISQLNQQLTIIDELKKQQKGVVDRIGIIDQLQATRSQVATIFSDMVKILPSGVYLTSIKLVEDNIAITGKAESNARISEFMRNLETLPWVDQVSLSQIQSKPGINGYHNDFLLALKLKVLQGTQDIANAQAALKDGKKDKTVKKTTKP